MGAADLVSRLAVFEDLHHLAYATRGARAKRSDRGQLRLVGHAADVWHSLHDLFHFGAHRLIRNLARDQRGAVERGNVDVDIVGEAGADTAAGAQLDRVVIQLRARGAAVLDRRVSGAGTGADQCQLTALQQRRARHDGKRQPCAGLHPFAPNSWKSMLSHRQCSTSKWTSWIRAVLRCGTHTCTSSALMSEAILPPPFPVNAMTRTPSSCAAPIASRTLAELPLVEMASSTSPARPIARSCLEKTCW